MVRTGVSGFVEGWGPAFTNLPTGLTNVIAVSAGPRGSPTHSLASRADGTVAAWGNNAYGQCNVPPNLTNVAAVAAGGRHSVALQRDGGLTLWSDTSLGRGPTRRWT